MLKSPTAKEEEIDFNMLYKKHFDLQRCLLKKGLAEYNPLLAIAYLVTCAKVARVAPNACPLLHVSGSLIGRHLKTLEGFGK